MNKIKNDSQRLLICEGCPYHFIRVICDGLRTDPEGIEKDYHLECTHVSACERALRKAQESYDSD